MQSQDVFMTRMNETKSRKIFRCASLLLLLSASAVVLPIQSVGAYASWMKCYVELDDKDEVIMHKPIIPPEDQAEDEKVYIEIQPYASNRGDPWMVATTQQHGEIFPSSIYYNRTHAAEATASLLTTLLKVRLKIPRGLKRKNVQFVAGVTGEGASFVGPGVLCDGRRTFSEKHDQHVLLQIRSIAPPGRDDEDESPPPSARRIVDDNLSSLLEDIELVAGWAAGYEAVKLTPKLVVRRKETLSNRGESDMNDESIEDDRGEEL